MDQQKKYAVIICTKCKRPKIIETGKKTTLCQQCGKKIDLSKISFIFQTNNLSEAQQVIGQINAEKNGHLKEFKTFLKQSH